MSLFSKLNPWPSLARKLSSRGGLASAGSVEKLRRQIEKQKASLARLEQKMREVKEGLRPPEPPPMPPARLKPVEKIADEQALFRRALELKAGGDPDAALELLDNHAALAARRHELLAVKASIVWSAGSRSEEALALLTAAVDAVEPLRTTLFWGPDPIISNAYWSRAMQQGGRDSKSFMWMHYAINRKEDFDLYAADVMPSWLGRCEFEDLGRMGTLPHILAFLHLIRHASVVHLPVTGSFLGQTDFWHHEPALFRRAGVKTVLLPYGGDYYCCSRVQDPCVRLGLLANYPALARRESATQERLTRWQEQADCVLCGYMLDAMGRWDVTTFNFFHIDTGLWRPQASSSMADGVTGEVKVLHSPNHRGFKGTEYLMEAVDELKQEGLKIELRLLEGVPNSEVRQIMGGCDILAEQFIATAYAMSGIEGMASGIPVMANLHDEYYTRVCRRYSFLNECPILSTTPENLKENLRLLVTRPGLRAELGKAGREYVEKYHSYEAARFLFGKIHSRLLAGDDEPLVHLFHPLTSESARSRPRVVHPLVENRLPEGSPYRS